MVLGCRVDAIGTSEAVARIVALLEAGPPSLVVTLGTEMVVHAQEESRFRAVVNASALSLCDTIGVKLAALLHGVAIPERVSGIDLIDPLCEACAQRGVGIFLLGGRGDTAERAGAALRARHPQLRIAGARDGYFADAEAAAVAAQIQAGGARLLLAGLGSPRQELFVADNLARTGCRVGIGIGGSLDVLAGNVERAPVLVRRLNLEWLYRLVREPARWRRQLALPYFVWLALCEWAAPLSRRYS
jgi:N-acetylglucosaminyldiphosphoundecaprenol N-acetyl-beta-D-mannosaminyltransferase